LQTALSQDVKAGTAEEIYGFCLQSFTCIDVQEKKNPVTISFQDQLVELTVRKCSFASKLSTFVLEFIKTL